MMSTKVISSYYARGYSVAQGNNLYITSTGGVGYFGVYAGYNATITNEGFIGGVRRYEGIEMGGGGLITNGSSTFTGAEIRGYLGVLMKYVSGSVTNFGLIEGVDSVYGFGDGIELNAGGVVRNGSVASRSAVIEGAAGVSAYYGTLDVHNYGLISGAGVNKSGVYLGEGGHVINGANTDATAIIQGGNGVFAPVGAAFVSNYGTITGHAVSGEAIFLGSGGAVNNGSGGDHAALIQGAVGVFIEGATGAVTNAGTILGTGGYSVIMDSGGSLTNGSLNNPGALIQGYAGIYLYGAAHGSNFGTISGTGDRGSGVHLSDGASVTNGAAGHAAGLIEGYVGVSVYYNAATVTNFGTIIGTGGEAVRFAAATDVLEVSAHSTFIGAVLGAGGTLDLLSGTGTITGLFAAGGNVTVSGSMATTTFQNFGTVEISAGATFTDKGVVKTAAGQTVDDAGTLNLSATGKNTNAGLIETTGAGVLTIAGPLLNAVTGRLVADGGTLVVNGTVTGVGAAMIDGGTLDLTSSFNDRVAFTGTTGVLHLAQSTAYTANITGFSRSGATSLDLGGIGFVGSSEATFSGTTSSGVLTVTDGTHTAHINLKGNYTTSTFVASSDSHGGTIVVDSTSKDSVIAPSGAKFIEAMAGFGAAAADGQLHASQAWPDRMLGLANPRVAAV